MRPSKSEVRWTNALPARFELWAAERAVATAVGDVRLMRRRFVPTCASEYAVEMPYAHTVQTKSSPNILI